MLAGYLPFDDDPSNPEGDNINLLYKYITTTPLTFPEYVTPHARDLLRRILVPDPRKRADLFEVARHSWLSEYHHVVSHITSSTTNVADIAHTTVPSGKLLPSCGQPVADFSKKTNLRQCTEAPPYVKHLREPLQHLQVLLPGPKRDFYRRLRRVRQVRDVIKPLATPFSRSMFRQRHTQLGYSLLLPQVAREAATDLRRMSQLQQPLSLRP